MRVLKYRKTAEKLSQKPTPVFQTQYSIISKNLINNRLTVLIWQF